ncbi:MAG: SirB1 family protein, partial [Gammaproteobacteria bacterium]
MTAAAPPNAEPVNFEALVAGPDETLDLARIALAIARDAHPDLDPDACLARLDAMATAVRESLDQGASIEERLAALDRQLFDIEGFAGNEDAYYDPRNSFLNEVLERRIGIPITLCVIYLEVGWRLALPLVPVSFPAHFLVAATGAHRVFIDPFNRGERLDEDDLAQRLVPVLGAGLEEARAFLPQAIRATPRREVAARMLRNLKAIYASQRELQRLLTVSNRMIALNSEDAEAVRDRGHVLAGLECHRAAYEDYLHYLRLAPGASDAADVAAQAER